MLAGSSNCWAELNFELWIGDATVIHAKRVRKQKTDRQDAQLILRLLLKDDFPQIWVPSWRQALPAGVSSGVYAGQPIIFAPIPWPGVLPPSLDLLLRAQPIMPVLAPETDKAVSGKIVSVAKNLRPLSNHDITHLP
jgi:hypothetical protein